MPIPNAQATSSPVVSVPPHSSAPGPVGTGTAPLVMQPEYPFVLAYHPDVEWTRETAGLDEPTFLPRLQRISCMPGVAGAKSVGEGEDPQRSWETLLTNCQRKGWRIIPGDVVVDGVVGYGRAYEVRSKSRLSGHAYRLRWEVPKARARGQRQKFGMDRAGYNRWRLRLVELGIVPPMDEVMADEMRRRAVRHRERREAEINLADAAKTKLLALDDERIEGIDTAARVQPGDTHGVRELMRLSKDQLLAASAPLGQAAMTKSVLARLLDQAGISAATAMQRAGGDE